MRVTAAMPQGGGGPGRFESPILTRVYQVCCSCMLGRWLLAFDCAAAGDGLWCLCIVIVARHKCHLTQFYTSNFLQLLGEAMAGYEQCRKVRATAHPCLFVSKLTVPYL